MVRLTLWNKSPNSPLTLPWPSIFVDLKQFVVVQSWPHGLQHAPLSLTISQSLLNFMSSSQWCYASMSSSLIPFFSCPQSFPTSGSFPMSQLFASGGQSIRASASLSILPKNIQGLFPLGWTGLISLQSKGLSRVFSSSTIQKHQLFGAQSYLWSGSHIHTWLKSLFTLSLLYGKCESDKSVSQVCCEIENVHTILST